MRGFAAPSSMKTGQLMDISKINGEPSGSAGDFLDPSRREVKISPCPHFAYFRAEPKVGARPA